MPEDIKPSVTSTEQQPVDSTPYVRARISYSGNKFNEEIANQMFDYMQTVSKLANQGNEVGTIQSAPVQASKPVDPFSRLQEISSQNKGVNINDPRYKYSGVSSNIVDRNVTQKELDLRNKWLGNYRPIDGYNLENLIGDRQSVWQKIGHGIVRTAGGTVTKFVQGIGYIIDMTGGAVAGDYTEYLDNGIGEAVGSIEEALKDALPIYKSTKYSQGSILDKMGTASFWMDDFADGAAFALSAFIPGGIIGKVGAGTKIVNALGKYSKMTQAMTKLNKLAGLGKYSPKALQVGFDRTLYTLYSSVSEAAFEAASVKKEIMNTYKGTINPDTGVVYTEQELKEMASTGAANTFKGNMALLMLSNRLEAGLMFGKSATGLVKPAKMLKELDRSAIKSNLKAFGRGIPKGVISEGGEEMVQYGISQHQIETAGKHEAWYSALGNTLQRTAKGFGEEEGMMNFITGAILGSTMGSISNVSENIGKRNTYRTISSNLDNNRDNLYAILGDIYERQDGKIVMEDQEIIDKDGNKKTIKAPKFNSNSAFQDGKRFSGMVALANEYRNAIDRDDTETANLIRDHAIRKWAIDYFMQGADAKFTIREMNDLLKQEATLASEKKERIVREDELQNIQELQKHFAKVISNAFDAYRTSVNPVIMARYDLAKTTEEKTAINAYMSSLYHSLNMKADLIDRQNEIQKLIVDLDARLQSEELNAVEKAVLSDKKAEIVDYSNKLDQQIKSYDNDVNESYNKMEREEWINDYIKKMNDEKDAVDNTLLYKDIDEKFEAKEKDIEERIKTATTEGNVDELNAIKKDIEELRGSYFTTGFKGRQQRRAIENADRLILKINKSIEAARMVSLAKGLEGINAAKSKEELEEIFNDLAPEQQSVLSEALEVRKTAITRKEEWTPEKTEAAINRLFDPKKEHNYAKVTTVNGEEFICDITHITDDAIYFQIIEAADPELVGKRSKISITDSEFMEPTIYVYIPHIFETMDKLKSERVKKQQLIDKRKQHIEDIKELIELSKEKIKLRKELDIKRAQTIEDNKALLKKVEIDRQIRARKLKEEPAISALKLNKIIEENLLIQKEEQLSKNRENIDIPITAVLNNTVIINNDLGVLRQEGNIIIFETADSIIELGENLGDVKTSDIDMLFVSNITENTVTITGQEFSIIKSPNGNVKSLKAGNNILNDELINILVDTHLAKLELHPINKELKELTSEENKVLETVIKEEIDNDKTLRKINYILNNTEKDDDVLDYILDKLFLKQKDNSIIITDYEREFLQNWIDKITTAYIELFDNASLDKNLINQAINDVMLIESQLTGVAYKPFNTITHGEINKENAIVKPIIKKEESANNRTADKETVIIKDSSSNNLKEVPSIIETVENEVATISPSIITEDKPSEQETDKNTIQIDVHESINEDPHSDIPNDITDTQSPKNDDISPIQLSVSQNNILNVNLKNDRLTEEQREFITSTRLMIDDEVVLVIDMTEIDTNKDKHDRIVKIMNGQKITSEDVEDLRNTIPIEIRSKGNMFATMANNNYLQLIIDTFNPIKDMIEQAKHEEEVKTKIVKFMSEINSYKDRVKTPAAAKLIVDAYIDLFGIDPREHAGNVPDVSLATTIMRVMLNNRVLGKYKSKFAANGKLIDEEIFSRLEQNINKWIDINVSDLATSKAIRDIAVKQIVDSGKVNAEALKAIKIKGKVVRKTSSTPIETKGDYRNVKNLFDMGFINVGIVQNDGSIMPLTGKNRTPFKSPTGEKYNDGKTKLFFIINSKLTPTGISYPVAYYTNFINGEEAKIATTELKKAIKYKIHDIENESNQNENLIAQHMSKVKDIFNTSKIHFYERIITEKINDNEIRKGIGTIEIDNKLYNMYVANYTIEGKEYSRLEFKRDEDGKIFIKEQIDELFTTARHNVNYDMIFEKDKYGKVSYRADASDNIIKMINDGILLTELNPVVRGDNYRFFDIQGRDGMNNIQIDIQIMPSAISEVSIQNEEGVPTNLSIDDIDLGGGDEFNFDNETDNDKKC